MERIYIKDLQSHIGKEVVVAGWVDVRRDHGKLIFIDLRDSSGVVQTVALPNHTQAHEAAETVRSEWVIEITGNVNKRPDKMINTEEENGHIEIEMLTVSILGKAHELPFERNAEINLDTNLDYRPLTLRNTREQAIFKVQSKIIEAYREALLGKKFVEIQAPKIVGDDAEGGGNVFELEYFKNQKAYLATSPQLYKQIMVGVYEKVFATGNVFRAEKHSTSRHLNEYTSLDAEFGFIKDHQDVMSLLQFVMQHITRKIQTDCKKEFEMLNASLPLCKDKFPQLKMKEALELVGKSVGKDYSNEPDLAPEHERWLCEYAKREHNCDFIFITHYPSIKRPFYAYDDPQDPGTTKSFDLLFRGVEVTTGGQRVHDYDTLVEKAKAKGLDPANFSFFLQAFKYGMPPHGGWGMGLERLTQKYLLLDNVKEATLFPREINRIDTLLSQ